MTISLRVRFIKFLIDLVDHKAFNTLFARIYKRLFAEVLPQNMVIFDVGSHEGEFITLYRKLFPFSQIHCFEPDSVNFHKMEIKFSKTPGIYLNNFGIGESNATKPFYRNILSYTSSFKEIDLKAGWTKTKSKSLGVVPEELIVATEDIQIRTLDDYIKEKSIEKIHILKIDVEGYEFQCLKGCLNTLADNRIDSIQLEIHFDDMYKERHSLTDLEELLYPFDYRLYKKKRHPFLKCLEVIFAGKNISREN